MFSSAPSATNTANKHQSSTFGQSQTVTLPIINLDNYFSVLQKTDAFMCTNLNSHTISELDRNLQYLQSSYHRLMEKYGQLLDALPQSIYQQAFGDKVDEFLKIKDMKDQVKAKIFMSRDAMEEHDIDSFECAMQ